MEYSGKQMIFDERYHTMLNSLITLSVNSYNLTLFDPMAP